MMNPTREISTVTSKFSEGQLLVTIDIMILYSVKFVQLKPLCTKATKLSRKPRTCEKHQHFNSESLIFVASLH